jgi:uncharacterized protein
MKIYLNEITEMETELDFTQDESWVLSAVERVDEAHETEINPIHDLRTDNTARAAKAKAKPRDVSVHFSLRKVDEVVVMNGRVKTYISLVCSRCANAFQLKCQPNFAGLFSKDPVMAGVGHLTDGKVPSGQNQGHGRHAHDENSDELQAQGKDLDITYLSNDYVDLSEVLTEHLQLQVPFQPLCREDCKGICPQCGTDLNVGRCACAKITGSNPFSILRDLKI